MPEPIEKTLNDSIYLSHMKETHPDIEVDSIWMRKFFATRPYTELEVQAIRESEMPLKEELAKAHEAYRSLFMWLGPSLCKDLLEEIRRIEAEIEKLSNL
tara:strand:- start:645 stop:944 length:300 start_codon:yes stop_codon:yes gene_type:complete